MGGRKMRVSSYDIAAGGLPGDLKAALVTDLHQREPEEVISALQSIRPDLICMAGDILERNDIGTDPRQLGTADWARAANARFHRGRKRGNSENAYHLFREAGKLAPVFMSVGNHEWYFQEEDQLAMAHSGVILLDNQDAKWKGIRIGGLSSAPDLQWLKDFSEKDGYKILLSHHPEYYRRYLRQLPIDLILSGHAHGGQIRIKGQGLFAPGQGFFPQFTRGVYENRLVVSAGCANTVPVPRWGNPLEVVVIHLRGGKNVDKRKNPPE